MSEKGLMLNSHSGGTFQKSVGATSNATLAASTEVQSCLVWTETDGVYFQIGAKATASHAKLLANCWVPLPYENLAEINLYNSTGSAAIIYCVYRAR